MSFLPALTGVRFVAALLVLLYHFVRLPDAFSWLNNLFAEGQRGVEFFFVLSGFVLGYNYFPKATSLDRRDFWAARVARVAPLYWLSLAVSLPLLARLLYVDFKLDHVGAAGYGLLFFVVTVPGLQTLTPLSELAQGWNTPAWSLSIEAICYLLFPGIVALASRLTRAACLGIVSACIAALFAFDWLLPHLPERGTLWGISGQWLYRITPIYNFPMFVTGVALSRVFLLSSTPSASGATSPLTQRGATWSAASVVVAAITLVFFASGVSRLVAPLTTGLSVALFASLIYILAQGYGPLAAVLSQPAMRVLGDASFALYLLQAPLKMYLQQFYSKVLGVQNVSSASFYVPLILLAIVVSLLVHRFFEVPARTRVKAFLSKRSKPAIGAATHPSSEH